MKVRVLLFASCRDIIGARELSLDMETGAAVQDLVDCLVRRYPSLRGLSSVLQTAVNLEYAGRATPLNHGDVVALIPPVSGGSGGERISVSERPIGPDDVHALIRTSGDGAVVTFAGVVRDNTGESPTTYLEYDAYAPMAERKMLELSQEAKRRWPITEVAILHRVGRLQIGDISVLIGVSSPHRAEAFTACQFLIDRLKEVVPIWKKEVGPTGQYWVEGPTATAPQGPCS